MAGSADRVQGILLTALGLWLALRQVDGVLAYLQDAGSGGYGASDLYAVSPNGLPVHVRDLLAVWETTRPVSHVAFAVYTVLDLVFVALYTLLFLRLFRRLGLPQNMASPIDRALRKAPRVVGLLALVDVLEDLLRLAMVAFHDASGLVVYAAWFATTVKWVALATVVLLLVRAWHTTGLSAGPGRWTADSWWALGRLRIPALFLVAFGLVLMFDPTGQVGDSFRRWLDSPEQALVSAAFTVGGAALLGLATWTTSRRAVLAGYGIANRPLSPVRWGTVAALLGVTAALLDLPNLLGLAIAIGVVAALELWWRMFGGRVVDTERRAQKKLATKRRIEAARAPSDGREREVRRVARGLSTWPLLALLLGLVGAWTAPPVVLLPLEHDTTRALFCAIGAVVALAVVGVLARAILALLSGLEADRPAQPSRRITLLGRTITVLPAGLESRHIAVAAVCVALCAAAILRPLDFPSLVGPVAMTAVILALFIVLLGEGQRYGDTHPPSAGLTFVGFSRVPVILVFLIALVLASVFDDGSYHSAHVNGGPRPERNGITLETTFGDWSRRNCAGTGGRDRMIPMVFVASQGGGIRAAYWTSSVLTDVLRAPPARPLKDPACPNATTFGQVFAMGGASGGSVGVTTYTGQASTGGRRWYRDVMGDTDFVAVPVSWALLVDLPRSLVGFDGPDRQRRFEQVWEREDERLTQDFFAGQGTGAPVLMLSGTQVETGCRMNISPLRLTAPTEFTSQGECAALLDRPASARDTPQQPSSLLPTAALTSDVLDFLCEDESLDRSTAALTSARFPYVSPSGQMSRCTGGRTTAVVDGGYADNTGGQPILNLWARLEPLVAAHNANLRAPLIVPVFVDIDNHYSKPAKGGPGKRTRQLLVPPLTAARSDQLDDRGVEQLANAEFSTVLPGAPDTTCKIGKDDAQRFVRVAPTESPGVQAPLGWTLSRMSMDDLDRQRSEALKEAPAVNLRAFLNDGTIDCEG